VIHKANFGSNRTLPADATTVLSDADGTFTGNAVHEFSSLISTLVIRGTFRTDAGNPLFFHERFFIVLLQGHINPLFSHTSPDTPPIHTR
jgi:hypothetical protein